MTNTPSPFAAYFYVSAIDGRKKYMIAGPYLTHAKALAAVDTVRRDAERRDPRAYWMAWGTAGSSREMVTPMGPV